MYVGVFTNDEFPQIPPLDVLFRPGSNAARLEKHRRHFQSHSAWGMASLDGNGMEFIQDEITMKMEMEADKILALNW